MSKVYRLKRYSDSRITLADGDASPKFNTAPIYASQLDSALIVTKRLQLTSDFSRSEYGMVDTYGKLYTRTGVPGSRQVRLPSIILFDGHSESVQLKSGNL